MSRREHLATHRPLQQYLLRPPTRRIDNFPKTFLFDAILKGKIQHMVSNTNMGKRQNGILVRNIFKIALPSPIIFIDDGENSYDTAFFLSAPTLIVAKARVKRARSASKNSFPSEISRNASTNFSRAGASEGDVTGNGV
jgi:hypothetical protein